ncbi:MAG TPA: PAS domain S-box protein, partial [Anaeromyxobacteraceae bacterium]|nr:PAS domain S-box protein [Anaeromyxobacteraceae bacterium]
MSREPEAAPGADDDTLTALEAALRSSRARYQNLVDALPVAIYVNRGDRIAFANAACAALFGAGSPDALVGRSVFDFFEPLEHGIIRERLRDLRARQVALPRIALHVVRLDGQRIEVEVAASSFDDGGERATHVVLRDVTVQRLVEGRIRHLNGTLEGIRRVNRLIRRERSPGLLLRRSLDLLVETGGLQSATVLLRDPFGLRVEASAGRPEATDRFARLVAERGPPPCVARAATGRPVVIRDRTAACRGCPGGCTASPDPTAVCLPLRSDGRDFGVVHALLPAGVEGDPDEVALLAELASDVAYALRTLELESQVGRSEESLHEIGERSRTERRRAEDRYQHLVESLQEVVFAVAPDGRLTFVSGAVGAMGYRPDEVLGRRFQEFAHPDDREALEQAFAARLEADAGPYEFRVFDGAGKVRIVRSSGRRVFEEGRLVGLAGVLIDLTSQRSTEEQLRAAQKMEAIGRLAGGVAHDFNNLLTVINSYARLAGRGLPDGDARHEALDEILKAGERAAALTRQLLAFGRRQVLQPVVLDVNELVEGMQRMLARLLGEDVTLRVLPSPDAGRIRADAGQVEQVLMNLAVNARDAMPGGGTLVVETANVELDEAFVARHAGAQTGAFVRLRVRDTGCGMDAATLDRLFEPFFTTKPAGRGTGLGLATVYGIVKQSGGGIWVESEPGRGATFDVCFPRVEDEVERRPPEPSESAGPGAGTILFVEDDAAIRTLAGRVLAEEGYEVLLAATGGEALLLAERHRGRIDLV